MEYCLGVVELETVVPRDNVALKINAFCRQVFFSKEFKTTVSIILVLEI